MPSSSSSSSSSSASGSSTYPTLHLRAEVKPYEHRSCLSPNIAKALIEAGYPLNVERSSKNPDYTRIFHDDEYAAIGAKLVPEGSWVDAPTDRTIIIGLKELPEEDTFPLRHVMVHFAHCYKEQTGWQKVLKRFIEGEGLLYDLEFLEEENGRRVAAFGFHAGFAGAALALKNWCWQFTHPDNPALPSVQIFTNGHGYYENIGELIQQLKTDMHHPDVVGHTPPRVMVLGAKGRCGRGAVDLLKKVGVAGENVVQWDMEETKNRDGPYPEIIDSDIFINTIYLTKKILPFLTNQTIDDSSRRLRVICDVSCDPNSANNPIPIYDRLSYFNNPTLQIIPSSSSSSSSDTTETKTKTKTSPAGPPLSLIAIDHLPSLLPREASEAFGKDLLPSLLSLKDREKTDVWKRAEKMFREKCKLVGS